MMLGYCKMAFYLCNESYVILVVDCNALAMVSLIFVCVLLFCFVDFSSPVQH